jgi:hypothetical protein
LSRGVKKLQKHGFLGYFTDYKHVKTTSCFQGEFLSSGRDFLLAPAKPFQAGNFLSGKNRPPEHAGNKQQYRAHYKPVKDSACLLQEGVHRKPVVYLDYYLGEKPDKDPEHRTINRSQPKSYYHYFIPPVKYEFLELKDANDGRIGNNSRNFIRVVR